MSGAAFAILSAVLFGLSAPVAKIMLGDGISPWLLAGLLYLGSGMGLAATLFARRWFRVRPREAPLRRADLPWLALIILFGGVAGPVLLMFGLTTTPASTAALLLNVEGLATMAIAWVVFREPVGGRILFGATLILAGSVTVAWSGSGALGLGAIFIVAACIGWGIDNNLTRKLSAADPVQITAVKGLVAGTVNLGIGIVTGGALPGVGGITAALALGIAGYGVSLVLFVIALRHIGAARTGAYFAIAPFVGAIFGVTVLGEPATVFLIVGGLLMAIGVIIHLVEHHEHEHAHEPLEHDHRHVHDAHHQHAHSNADPAGEPHAHWHVHARMIHRHPHFPDLHHRHRH